MRIVLFLLLFLPAICLSQKPAETSHGSKLLASFEDSYAPFNDIRADTSSFESAHATEGAKSLLWKNGAFSWSGSQSWFGYDTLLIDFYNPEESFVEVWFSIRDRGSVDYWTRVNYPLAIPPGASTIRIPTALYVGEKSRPGRPLDLNFITVVTFDRSPDYEGKSLYVDNLRLIKEAKVGHEGILAFDLGTEMSPVFPGMTKFTKKDIYDIRKGYGLRGATIWDPYPQSSDALQPDSLYRDSLMILTGTIVVDLPKPGRYKVFMNLDHPGGYWGEYPYYRYRRVYAEGKLVVNDLLNVELAKEKYFSFFDTEDRLTDEIFDKYLPTIFKEKQFDVEVTDGYLELNFPEDNCTEFPCFGTALSTLIIAPEEKAADFDKYLAYIKDERRKEFNDSFRKYVPEAHVKEKSSKAPFVLFSRNYMEEVAQNDSPREGEEGAPVSIQAAQGEREPLSYLIYPFEDISEATVTFSDLKGKSGSIAKENITVGIVVPKFGRMNNDGTLFTVTERYIRETDKLALRKQQVSRVWSTLTVPLNTPKGVYSGKSTVTFKNGPQISIPIEVKVYGFTLPPVDIGVGPFNSTIQEAYWYSGTFKDREHSLQTQSLQKMREAGITAFTVAPHFGVQWKDGEVKLESSYFDEVMSEAKTLGFTSVVGYKDMISDFDLCRGNPQDQYKTYPRVFYYKLAEALKKRGAENKWLPTSFIICDEPTEGDFTQVISVLNGLSEYRETTQKFTVTYSKGGGYERLLTALDLSILNEFDESTLAKLNEGKKRFGFYNRASRDTFGFYLYRLKKISPLELRLAWNWNQNLANPYYALDAREDDYNWCNSTPEGKLRCTVFFDRHIREGIDDYRYARALELRIAEATDPLVKEQGNTIVAEILRTEAGREPVPGKPVSTGTRLGELRKRIGAYLDSLS